MIQVHTIKQSFADQSTMEDSAIHESFMGVMWNNGEGLPYIIQKTDVTRSEERRVGKECRSRWSPYH